MISEKKIIGHKKQINLIAKSIRLDRIHPFWIFFGIDGIGKSTIAHKFAKCLLSESNEFYENLDLPFNDKVHNLVDNKTHPDFFEINNLVTTIDEIRDLTNKVRKTSALSRRKVIIINHAEDLNKNICNSLLKILEEPPKNTIFILVCSGFGKLPITLLSRAIKLHFNPLNKDEVLTVLNSLKIGNAKTLVEIADGSIGDALYLHENDGINLYKNISGGFSSDYENSNKTMKFLIENNFCSENFKLLKKLIIKVLKAYLDTIIQIDIDSNFEKFINKVSIDHEVEKILKIISDMNREDILQLDKSAIISGIFETFFERNAA